MKSHETLKTEEEGWKVKQRNISEKKDREEINRRGGEVIEI